MDLDATLLGAFLVNGNVMDILVRHFLFEYLFLNVCFLDCNDSLDEANCTNCRKDQFHCGHGVCINRDNICNGVRECPDGRDERQCCMFILLNK